MLLIVSCIKLIVVRDDVRFMLDKSLWVEPAMDTGCVLEAEMEELLDMPLSVSCDAVVDT